MATPLKIRDAGGNIQELTTAEENYVAYQIGLHLAADSANGIGGLTTNASHTSTGTYTNTFFNEPVGTHPSTSITSGSTVTTLYQNQGTSAVETDSDVEIPLMWVDSASQTGFKQMPDADLNEAVERYLSTIFTNDYPGVFKLGSVSPGPNYSVWLSSVFTDTRTDGTSVAYNIYRRDTYSAPTEIPPMYVRDNGGFDGIQAMTDRQIKYSFGQRAKSRIGASKIGTYQIRSSAAGAPTDPGTWISAGSATDTKQTTSEQSFTTTYVGTYTIAYSRNYTGNYQNTYTGAYNKVYTGTYTSNYASNYTSTSNVLYTNTYNKPYTSNYVRSQLEEFYTSTFATTYVVQFNLVYSGNFAVTYLGNYARNYVGNYTRVASYTRNFTGNVDYQRNYTRAIASYYQRNELYAGVDPTIVQTYVSAIPNRYSSGPSLSTIIYLGQAGADANYTVQYVRVIGPGTPVSESFGRYNSLAARAYVVNDAAPNFFAGYTGGYEGPIPVKVATGFGTARIGDGVGENLGNETALGGYEAAAQYSTYLIFAGFVLGRQNYDIRRIYQDGPDNNRLYTSSTFNLGIRLNTYAGSLFPVDPGSLAPGEGYFLTYNGPLGTPFGGPFFAGSSPNPTYVGIASPVTLEYAVNYASVIYIGNPVAFYTRLVGYQRNVNTPYIRIYNTVAFFDANYDRNLDYQGNYVRNYTGNYVRNYTGVYTRRDYLPYLRVYDGTIFVVSYTSEYQKEFTAPYNKSYTTTYTGNYENEYTNNFENFFNVDYSTAFNINYTSDTNVQYETIFETDYIGNFEGLTIDATDETVETYTLYVRIS